MNINEKLKLLVSRIVEAHALRELLDHEKLKETRSEMPHIDVVLKESVAVNSHKFEQNFVEPICLSRLSHLNQMLMQAGDDELKNIADTSIFIMEREIYMITKKIIEGR